MVDAGKQRGDGEARASQAGQDQPFNARWRQVLALGEELLALDSGAAPFSDTLRAQRELILSTTERLLEGHAALWMSEELSPSFTNRILGSLPDPPQAPTALMQRALASRQPCCSQQAEAEVCLGCVEAAREGLIQAIAAPLLAKDREQPQDPILGVLQVERLAGPPFSLQEIEMLDGLAVQAALALRADRQVAIERWRVEQLSLVRKVSAQIADVRDLDELLRRVTQLILHTFDYYYVGIFTLEPGQDVLHFRASAGPSRRQPEGPQEPESQAEEYTPRLTVHLGQGFIGQVALTGQEILANDVSQEGRFRYSDVLPETRSEVTLPLRIEDRVLGVLDVQSDQPDDFHETDLLVLRALADNIAIAIEGAQLYSALRKRAEQISTVSDVSNAITSILHLDDLLNEVVQLIQKRFGYPFVHLFTVHPGRRKIFYEAGSGARSEIFKAQGFAHDLDDPQGIIPWVARTGDTLLVNDVEKEPRYRPSSLPPEQTRSELTVPLIFGGNVLGVLDVQSDQLNAFGEEDRFLFEALADNIAVAMRNAYLYRSESWRRQVADSLREVAGLLSADVDLGQVLDAILVELERNLPCDIAAIWLVDEELPEEDDDSELPPLRLAAVRGEGSAWLDLDNGVTLQDFTFDVEPAEEGAPHPAGSLLVEALESNEPVIRADELPNGYSSEPLGAALGFQADYSAVAAPLRVGKQRLGVLTLAHRTTGRYGTEARNMTAAFASYAAVAIQNARLYEAAHEQAWVSTVLLQVAEATQSITNLNELLATVIRITPMLVGIKACVLYMLDEDETFVPAASSGLTSEQQVEFERWRFAPGDVPALDHLASERHPVILDSGGEDARLASILFDSRDPDDLFEDELLVLVPMLARGEVLGAFLVDYSNGPSGRRGPDWEALFDERLAIMQGIGHQTAIAVENIRLLKAQREEAYVSVALLQVAQAVVSNNDLDDILGSIVRITPILVGVKRAAIYLWDPQNRLHRLVQSYGMPRRVESYYYNEGEFPFLDAVVSQDSLLAYPLSMDADLNGDPPESWTHLLPPGPEAVQSYLEQEACLVLAFPLSVKGEVLGVLLVEEPDVVPLENLPSGNVNRRLREKRLEITTGISQQAAVAIQNDHFQRQMVERERLEREMQLAREIQRTFLPQQTPDLPGWELRVLWRTAREVGGDFYDFFELPAESQAEGGEGRRLGLVIADVADKGMPAALFMTMIRTLVRATAQEILSPGEALERVNNVLVPDAQQGMFVTLFYGVLSLESGQLRYANAGHNPPLLLKPGSRDFQALGKSGMALGVLEGNRLSERTVQLEAGDYLVLYTDGVTEAFSPEDEMFGDERLMQILHAALENPEIDTAQEMLDTIQSAINDFQKSISPSDDLTLLVLKREEK